MKAICHSLRAYLTTGICNHYVTLASFGSGQLTDKNLRTLLINIEDGKAAFLCDLAIYSKNRNFRLYLSQKMSKQVPLTIANENKFVFKSHLSLKESNMYKMWNEHYNKEYQLFLDCLVCEERMAWDDRDVQLLKYGGEETPVLDEFQDEGMW